MTEPSRKQIPGWVFGFGLIALLFAGLFLLPESLRTKTFEVVRDGGATGRADADFQLNREFPRVRLSGADATAPTKTTLEAIFRETGRKTLLVNLWATWCPPCIDELPSLEYLGRQLAEKRNDHLPFLVTISVDEGLKEIGGLSRTLDFRPSFPILHDPGGDFSTGVGTTRFPETYLISETGEVLYKWLGPQDWLSQDIVDRLAGRL